MSEESETQIDRKWMTVALVLLLSSMAALLYAPLGGYITLVHTDTEAHYLIAIAIVLLVLGLAAKQKGSYPDDQ